ncbi:hypothetical protein GCM10010988_27800 [Cnuibacter physcomitrellae]|uniref:Uncharacterized protein n=1 Tax=Cnuibacter physcomitrellae TaxID=1619308 RepID=A0A1X9LG19_9MICO|nr:MFS transporter [Cnuibacter physcomitrellae]ARJ04073.1 hypothetical protein B5808_01640 [Cnuibacter physcomitrellae]GGI40182.1 hypothetical protein GCM10010988_27800 [Cnuibacter physcomitrellae]
MSRLRLRSADIPSLEQTLVVCALIGAAQMTWGVVVPVLPLFADSYGIGVALLGVVLAAFGVGRILGNLPAGILVGRLPARTVVRVSALGLAAVTASTALAHDAVWLIVLRTATGVLGGATVTACFAVLLRGAPADARGRVVSLATVVQLSAADLGSLLGGAVLQLLGAGLVFPVAAVPLLLVLLWDLARPAGAYWARPVASAPEPVRDARDAAGAPGPARGRSAPGALVVGLIAVTFALFVARFAGEQGLIPVLAYGPGGLDPLGLGAALAAGTAASLIVLPLVGRWLDSGARAVPVLASAALAALGLIGVASTSEWWFAASVVAVSIGSSILGIVPGVVTAERFPPERVGVMVGVTRTAGDAGAALGPAVVFLVADVLDPGAGVLLLGALLLVAAVPFAVLLARPRRLSPGRGSVGA